ncbi:MAG: hypothetical protein ACFFDF_18615 [Candidatus Odinarchaeota archaeon]
MYTFKLKILLLGGKTVNKTSLEQRIGKKCFQTDYKMTIGVNILTKDVEYRPGEIAGLSIWDIGYQERFKIVRNIFYRGSSGFLLFFDLKNNLNFIEIRNLIIEIQRITGFIPFILAGYAIQSPKFLNNLNLRIEAQEFAEKNGGIYIETSPTSIDVIEEAFRKFIRKIIEPRA